MDNANIYYDTNVLKDLDTNRRQQAELIRNLVIESWENGVKLDVDTEEEKLIIVNLKTLDRDISKRKENTLKSVIKSEQEEQTGYRVEVVLNSVDFEVDEGVNHFYYLPVSIDRDGDVLGIFRNSKPINELPPGGLDKATLDSLILTAVQNGLKEIGNEVDNDVTDSDSSLPPTRIPVTQTPVRRPVGSEDGNDANSIDAERDALSDAIIKNITQIVMVQMDEALKGPKQQHTSQW